MSSGVLAAQGFLIPLDLVQTQAGQPNDLLPYSISVIMSDSESEDGCSILSGATNLGIMRTMGGCPIRQRVDASDGWSGSSPPPDSFSISMRCSFMLVGCQPSKLNGPERHRHIAQFKARLSRMAITLHCQ